MMLISNISKVKGRHTRPHYPHLITDVNLLLRKLFGKLIHFLSFYNVTQDES